MKELVYEKADDVSELAKKVLAEYTKEFDQVEHDDIVYMRSRGHKDSETMVARVFQNTPLLKFYNGGKTITMEVNSEIYDVADDEYKKMVVFHELLHICPKFNKKGVKYYVLVKHDVEDFQKVLAEFGGKFIGQLVEQHKARVAERKAKEKSEKKEAKTEEEE